MLPVEIASATQLLIRYNTWLSKAYYTKLEHYIDQVETHIAIMFPKLLAPTTSGHDIAPPMEHINREPPNKWILVNGSEFYSRELAMSYFGHLAADNILKSSFDDLCVIIKFVESYLDNTKVRKFPTIDRVFSSIHVHIFLHFDLVGETDISTTELAKLIRADKRKTKKQEN